MAGALSGTSGAVRVIATPPGGGAIVTSPWIQVDQSRDFTCQISLTGLRPATRYRVRTESRDSGGTAGAVVEGGFATAPDARADASVKFVVVTCGDYPRRDDA